MSIQYAVGDNDRRPWGRWEVLAAGNTFVIKKIDVEPGEKLSLQSHQHRSEHWTILSGEAAVTLDDDTLSLTVDQSVFIPARAKHRIQNTGEDLLTFIEIQTGAHLDENDIERFDDQYGRA